MQRLWIMFVWRGDVMDREMEPKILLCTECGEEFVFTSQAQIYFLERGYTEDPKRCKSCHTGYKKNQRNNNVKSNVDRETVDAKYPE